MSKNDEYKKLDDLFSSIFTPEVPKKKLYPVITMCGSSKFKDDFIKETSRLSLEGNLVISLGLFGHVDNPEIFTSDKKKMLDEVHLQKIDMSDAIFVVNKGGYIGESTKKEIEYAKKYGKKIIYMEKLKNDKRKNNFNLDVRRVLYKRFQTISTGHCPVDLIISFVNDISIDSQKIFYLISEKISKGIFKLLLCYLCNYK